MGVHQDQLDQEDHQDPQDHQEPQLDHQEDQDQLDHPDHQDHQDQLDQLDQTAHQDHWELQPHHHHHHHHHHAQLSVSKLVSQLAHQHAAHRRNIKRKNISIIGWIFALSAIASYFRDHEFAHQ